MTNAKLKIVEPDGVHREFELRSDTNYTVGRSKDNDIVLNDRRVSRKHAHIIAGAFDFKIVDGYFEDGVFRRSVNRVFVNGFVCDEKFLEPGDLIAIGETKIEFAESIVVPVIQANSNEPLKTPKAVDFDDKPLGSTQVLISVNELIGRHSNLSIESPLATSDEIKDLRRKAKCLIYSMK